MKYKIDIWTYGHINESYENDDIAEVLDWYKYSGWASAYDQGRCAFNLYEDGQKLSFDEEYELGFHD